MNIRKVKQLRIIKGFESARKALSRQAAEQELPDLEERERAVRKIIDDVRRRGDNALLEYTERFDGARLTSVEVSRERITRAAENVSAELKASLKIAAERIRAFHVAQKKSLRG